MLRFLVLSALMACAFGNVIMPSSSLLDGRIIGGVDTTIEEHPYQVSIRSIENPEKHTCGGSIIGSRKVLTAAHCCLHPVSPYTVQYGVTNIGTSDNLISVAQKIVHPGYNPETYDNDACVLLLDSDIVYSASAQPIAIAKKEPSAGSKAIVTGWGFLTLLGPLSHKLQALTVDVIARETCSHTYGYKGDVTDSMVCAGINGGGKDACLGDSGSPLVSGGELVGIVSWSIGCALPKYPGVYANVAGLSEWIESQ